MVRNVHRSCDTSGSFEMPKRIWRCHMICGSARVFPKAVNDKNLMYLIKFGLSKNLANRGAEKKIIENKTILAKKLIVRAVFMICSMFLFRRINAWLTPVSPKITTNDMTSPAVARIPKSSGENILANTNSWPIVKNFRVRLRPTWIIVALMVFCFKLCCGKFYFLAFQNVLRVTA